MKNGFLTPEEARDRQVPREYKAAINERIKEASSLGHEGVWVKSTICPHRVRKMLRDIGYDTDTVSTDSKQVWIHWG